MSPSSLAISARREVKPLSSLADGEARRLIREDLSSTLVVEAAAGTGKTTELVARILALLQTGAARLSSLVAVTFTEKAAGEMKLRLRTAIERSREVTRDPRVRLHLDSALRELEAAHIGTIHGFCADLLRERPVEAGIDPLFEVTADEEHARLYEEAFERWFQAALEAPGEGVRRVLRRRARERNAEGPRKALRDAGLRLVEQRDFDAPWARPSWDRERALDGALASLKELGKLAELADDKRMDPDDSNWAYASFEAIARFVHEFERREAARPDDARDYDGLEAELNAFARQKLWGWKGFGRVYSRSENLLRDDVLARRAVVKEELDRVLDLADADLAACLRDELRPLVAAYEALKERAGKLDFLDLLVRARNLLTGDPATRRALRERYTHFLVDEFQDTDPLQAEILLLLASDDPVETDPFRLCPAPGRLFLVGDPKQSIYRFRRADVAFYEGIKRRLTEAGARVLHLSTSFRSTPAIQSVVNAAFSRAMVPNGEGTQAQYVPLAPFRASPGDRPSVVALPVPRPYSSFGKVMGYAIEESFPDAVGAFVDWLVRKSGWTVEEAGSQVPIEPRHVCLLFKRFTSGGVDTTRPYVRALEARRLPHVLMGGRGFHEREEVTALRSALTAIEWPDDELAVYATLKGPLFALTDAALFAFRDAAGSLDFMRRIDEGRLDELTRPVACALGVLRDLHRGRNRRPYADTVARLLDATRAHAGFAIWPTGEQALANVLRVLDLARRAASRTRTTSFRAFVQRLEDDASVGRTAEASIVEEDTDGVRIMTVHKAKGLEFPVVMLVDPTARHTNASPSRYADPEKKLWATPICGASPLELILHRESVLRHDHEESVRLLYVAVTRARDLLVVPVVGDGPFEGSWLDALNPALYPKSGRAPEAAPGCPPFGRDTVLERPTKAWNPRPVRPGLHVPAIGAHRVVFWDPSILELRKQEEEGLRQQKLLAQDEGGAVAAESVRRYESWKSEREAVLAQASEPSIRVTTPTERKAEGARATVPIALERTDFPRLERPHGKRYGILVHALLAEVPLEGDDALLEPLGRTLGRMLGASDEELAFAIRAVRAVLAHPLFDRVRASGDVRREVSITLREDDGTLLEGVVDLAFQDETGGFTVIDYKTDLDVEPRRVSYEAQVELYMRAISEATGAPAQGVLLLV